MDVTRLRVGVVGVEPGASAEENEDTYGVRPLDGDRVLLAVADGASATVFARHWAQALVAAAAAEWPDLDDAALRAALDGVRSGFNPAAGMSMPWYVERKTAVEGSQAALIVAVLSPAEDEVEVRAVAVGDCTVVVLHGDADDAFPVASAAAFTTTPALVSSRPSARLLPVGHPAGGGRRNAAVHGRGCAVGAHLP